MPTANLNLHKTYVDDGLDSIVIVNALGDIPGGRSLDVSEVAADVEILKSGHILIQNKDTKKVKPLGVNEGAYASLPSGYQYLGVLRFSVPVKDPRAAIVTLGQVNAAACPYPVTDAIAKALPGIQFLPQSLISKIVK